jgi:hypothetical protein
VLKVCKTRRLAKALFPREKWVKTEPYIWVASSRLSEKVKEPDKWRKEMEQARILTSMGSVAYFLPEVEIKGETGRRCADLALDGEITEMKTVTGTRATLGGEFRLAYKQGEALSTRLPGLCENSVFVWLKSEMSKISVMSKIAGELKNRSGKGRFVCYFEHTKQLYFWTYDELRSIIGKK